MTNTRKPNPKLCVKSHTPFTILIFVTDICESPPSAVYIEKSMFPYGCQAMSSGHLLYFWDAQLEELSRETPGMYERKYELD